MKLCYIIEDLWPLYEEDLVQQETRAWIEAHCVSCPQCSKLGDGIQQLDMPLPQTSPEETIHRVTRKLQVYQLLFITLAFFLAMNTTLFSEQAFQFILSYFVLGAVMYTFYKSWLLSVLLVFISTALATIYDLVWSYDSFASFWLVMIQEHSSTMQAFGQLFSAIVFASTLHTLFALLGAVCSWLVQKGFQKE